MPGRRRADFAADVVAGRERAGAGSRSRGKVLPAGRRADRTERLDGLGFLSLVFDADLSPGLAAALPAADARRTRRERANRSCARVGVMSRHERLALDERERRGVPDDHLPRRPVPLEAGDADRGAAAGAGRGGRGHCPPAPSARSGPGRPAAARPTAASSGRAPPAAPRSGTGPLPDVPVLALSGSLDLRTPTAEAAEIVDRFPQGRLLVVSGVGHGVLGSDPSGCPERAVRAWLAGRSVTSHCPGPRAYLAPLAAFRADAGRVPKRAASPKRTLAIAAMTAARGRGDVAARERGLARPGPGCRPRGRRARDVGRLVPAHAVQPPARRLSDRRGPDDRRRPASSPSAAPWPCEDAGASRGELALRRNGLSGTLGGRAVRRR